MIEIVNQVTELMNPLMKVNDRTIYFCDIVVGITVITYRTIEKQKYTYYNYDFRILKGMCYESKPLKSGKKHFQDNIRNSLQLKKNQSIDYIKVILLKELSCSIYKD